MMNRLLLIVAFEIFVGNGRLPGMIVGDTPILQLTQSADLIVLGSAYGAVEPMSGAFTIRVTRVIKGQSAITGKEIDVLWHATEASRLLPNGVTLFGPLPPVSTDPISVSGDGIWFLKRPLNSWVLLPVFPAQAPIEWMYYPAPLSPLANIYAYPENASVTDKIASELAAGIEDPDPTHFFNFPFFFLYDGDLDTLKSPVIHILYQRLSESPESGRRKVGLRALQRSAAQH